MKNIEGLEREIEIFKQNIANSNKLVSHLQDTVNALKDHNSSIDNLTTEFSNYVPQKILEISSTSYAKANSELKAVFDGKISELIDIQKTVKSNIAELETFTKEISAVIIQTNNSISNSIREEISSELKAYPYNNRQYIDHLIHCLKNTEVKIDQSVEKICSVNDDVLEKILILKEVSDSIQDSNSEVVGALIKNSSEISDSLKNEIAQFEHNVNSTNGCINLLKHNLSLLETLSLHMHEASGTFDTNATSIISRVRQVTDTILNSNSELVDAFGKNSIQISNCISKNNSETLYSISNIFNRQEILINFLTKNIADLFDIITSNSTDTTNNFNTLKDKVTNIEKNIKFVKALGLAQVLILIFFFIASLIF